jgi:hypothetical protein
VRAQDADHRTGVVQLTPQHGLVGFIKVNPADPHTGFLALAGETLVVTYGGEVPGQEYT